MKIRILSEGDCRAVLDMSAAIDIQAEAFRLLATRQSLQGLRNVARSADPPGAVIFNPCFLQGGLGYGLKVISDYPRNEESGSTRMTGVVVLFDGATGHPQALLAAGYLTDLRTGAGTALAARYLARPESRCLALIGAGRVARHQLAALAEIFDLDRVLLSTRSPGRAEEFISAMRAAGGRIPADIRLVASAEEAVREADLVVTATTSEVPVLQGEWLRPGTFVASTGAYAATMREVDTETIRRASRRVIDSRTDCLPRAGDFLIPMEEGAIEEASIAELSELVTGTVPGRSTAEEISYFKSSGVPIQDLVTAQRIFERAAARGIGTEVDLGEAG